MTFMKKYYEKIAKKHGITSEEVEREITEAIKAAWQAPIGSKEKELQLKLFPDGNIPTNEEYIKRISEMVIEAKK